MRIRSFAWKCLAGVLVSFGCGPRKGVVEAEVPVPELKLSSTVPPDGTTGVARDVVLEARFAEPIDPATANSSSFIVEVGAGGAQVSGTVEVDPQASNAVRFRPTEQLRSGFAYAATLTQEIRSVVGGKAIASIRFGFTTADTEPPSVQAVFPPEGTLTHLRQFQGGGCSGSLVLPGVGSPEGGNVVPRIWRVSR